MPTGFLLVLGEALAWTLGVVPNRVPEGHEYTNTMGLLTCSQIPMWATEGHEYNDLIKVFSRSLHIRHLLGVPPSQRRQGVRGSGWPGRKLLGGLGRGMRAKRRLAHRKDLVQG